MLPEKAYFRWPNLMLWKPKCGMDLVVPIGEVNTEYNVERPLPDEFPYWEQQAQNDYLETLRADMEADLVQQYNDNPPSLKVS